MEEWKGVLPEHKKLFPLNDLTVDGIKRKFLSLNRKNIAIVDLPMAEDVWHAKRIRYRMTERTEMSVDDDIDVEELFPQDETEGRSEAVNVADPTEDSGTEEHPIPTSATVGQDIRDPGQLQSTSRPWTRRRTNPTSNE